jgi:hypothetical protein
MREVFGNKLSGHGGFWIVLDFANPTAPVAAFQHNAYYECLIREETWDTKSTGCGGWVEALPVCKRIESAFFRVTDKDFGYPEFIGLEEGREVAVFLKRGAIDLTSYAKGFDLIWRAIVETVRRENDQKKARWVEVTLRRGRLYRDCDPRRPLPDGQDSPVDLLEPERES